MRGDLVRAIREGKAMMAPSGEIYARCVNCGKTVKLNKWLLGDLHLCVEERTTG